ncbi:uncharacterized protein J3D65DRAFT_49875 [Phyllosticta citribraziliensis]|uniref:Uncharacterized protein n=1 Tax=Phyllosticta citribraziliensis TaxID=989973 RepID=A0ABR1MB69_9PEZI
MHPSTTAKSPASLQRRRSTLLTLPAELRIQIYAFALDFDGVARVLNRQYEAHLRGAPADDPSGWPPLATPGLLLVNRQVSHEARHVLHKKTLRIPHAMTPNGKMTDLMCRPLLLRVKDVDFTRDKSHDECSRHLSLCDVLCYLMLHLSKLEIDCQRVIFQCFEAQLDLHRK